MTIEKKQKIKTSDSIGEREIEKVSKQFDEFEKNIKEMTLDRMNCAPKEETELQTKMSNRQMQDSQDIYLKPKRSIYPPPDPKTGKQEVFNEKYRKDYEFMKEYVKFVAENKEIIGESITTWTKPFAGIPAEEWELPVNTPVWGPRYLAERIKGCSYHRFSMREDKITSSDGRGTYYGSMAVDTLVQRLDAHPVSDRKSVFMGVSNF